eukprot:10220211-Lingulodinium_polyedra.AAC.1
MGGPTLQRLEQPGSGALALQGGPRGCSTPVAGGLTPTPATAEASAASPLRSRSGAATTGPWKSRP